MNNETSIRCNGILLKEEEVNIFFKIALKADTVLKKETISKVIGKFSLFIDFTQSEFSKLVRVHNINIPFRFLQEKEVRRFYKLIFLCTDETVVVYVSIRIPQQGSFYNHSCTVPVNTVIFIFLTS